ncbi:hypothetical protein Athai_44220 [Actinocatenispora thailandica]|uniref:Uncharacterized protein n=1 Tax=Actinocatenispora thailandica TaxID=227318 RepID=A0A7R7HZ31_9ACTN|nr:hypothetical protein [Actinocatenispora thailandica]BCJ36919.1 hypothetical protein Athai_44220 [Actinocatenispora thailandica]
MTEQPTIRPRRLWYGIAIAVLVLGVAAGIGAFLFALRPALGDLQRFDTGQRVRLSLAAGQRRTLYVSGDTAGGDLHCTASPAGLALSETSGLTVTQGGESWSARYQLRADRAGSYRLTCTSSSGRKALAIGAMLSGPRLVGGIVAAIACPCGGLLFAGIVCLVVALRRHGRRRALRETAAPPGAA